MAGSTKHFGLGFFDFGDPLGTDFAGQIEVDRFVLIDKQLFGIMSILGNGVVDGWEVTQEGTLSVSISPGFGNINFMAGRTTFPATVPNIPPNSTIFIFARAQVRTSFSEEVDFTTFNNSVLDDPSLLLLARVTSSASSIESIDNSVRQEIGFLELIQAAIRTHKHRGGTLNASKIDLTSEVKGQLPSFRIADMDAEKITTGTFDVGRLPLIDHQSLENIGLLTHPQLDTFVKTLESSNKEIFGEISTSNLLQLIVAMKLIYDDPDSSFFIDGAVDENMINEFAIIPGITPDSYIDFDNSTADIDTAQHFVKGVPPTTGTSFFVNFDSELAFSSAFSSENLLIVGASVVLTIAKEETGILNVEGFESATESGQVLSTGGLDLFRKETVILSDNAEITANSTSTNVIEGFFSGKFNHRQSFRSQFVKDFDEAQDWSAFDSFILQVKTLDLTHGPVKLFFTSNDGEQSAEFVILVQNEVTSNNDTDSNNFETRVIDLSAIPFRNEVKSFTIFTDDLDNVFSFFIDAITVQRAVVLPEDGTMKLRFSAGAQVTFATIEWTSIESAGTEIAVRARSASSASLLTRSTFTSELNNGDAINLKGSDIEIEIVFTPDADRLISPKLTSLRILILTEAEVDGFTINEEDEFSRGTAANILINSNDTITLDTPIFVDSYYFALANTVTQINENTSGVTPFVEGEPVSLFARNAPIAPNQVFKAVEDGGTQAVTTSRLFEPRSARRQDDRSFIIADTYNDRVLQYDEDGILIAGIGSINYSHDGDKPFPISASMDTRSGILYIVWSKPIRFEDINISKTKLQTPTQSVQLIRDFDKILGLSTSELVAVGAIAQIMPVHLSDQNAGLVEQFPATGSFVKIGDGTVSQGINVDSIFFKTISNPLGIPLFVGNFAYIDGIFSPTYADKTSDDNFIIANGKVAVKKYSFNSAVTSENISLDSSVSSVIEVDKNNNIIFGSNVMDFSPFIPGRVTRTDTNTLLIGGLIPNSGDVNLDDLTFRSLSGDNDNKNIQKQVLSSIFFGSEDKPFFGAAILFDTLGLTTTFEYASPEGVLVSDVDIDPNTGNFVVAESSFSKSGRIIKLDSLGNIVFSFGEGIFSLINDINVQLDSSIIIST